MTNYHVDLQVHIEIFREVRNRSIVSPCPAWMAIEVAGFITPGAIVEIRAVATMASVR